MMWKALSTHAYIQLLTFTFLSSLFFMNYKFLFIAFTCCLGELWSMWFNELLSKISTYQKFPLYGPLNFLINLILYSNVHTNIHVYKCIWRLRHKLACLMTIRYIKIPFHYLQYLTHVPHIFFVIVEIEMST